MDSSASTEITFEFFPFVRVYKDGRVERIFTTQLVPAGLHNETGIISKDVVVCPDTGVSVRLYLPPVSQPGKKVPIVVYFHGGGFCIESSRSRSHHAFCNAFVAAAGVLAVSVDYRLAPEYPVPIAHFDSWAALQWVARQAGAGEEAEPWLRDHGDFDRIYLVGGSAGANLAHHLAMAAGGHPVFGPLPQGGVPVSIHGLVLLHPFFAGWSPAEDEELRQWQIKANKMWVLTCPSAEESGTDHPLVNLASPEAPKLSLLRCRRVIVFLAGRDRLGNGARQYNEMLRDGEWTGVVEMVEHEEEDHVFHIMKPDCENAKDLIERVALFINGD
ncbi:unnamed protein product [Victoria cruziana]